MDSYVPVVGLGVLGLALVGGVTALVLSKNAADRSYDDARRAAVAQATVGIPSTFGRSDFPGRTLRIADDSEVRPSGHVILFFEELTGDGSWQSLNGSAATPGQLRSLITPDPAAPIRAIRDSLSEAHVCAPCTHGDHSRCRDEHASGSGFQGYTCACVLCGWLR